MSWRDIQGFFTWPEYYEWLAGVTCSGEAWHPSDPKLIVEVGVYTGQSAAFLAEKIVSFQSDTTIDLVDVSLADARGNLSYLMKHGVLGKWHEMTSVDAAKTYEVSSVDAVFIDAEHDYENVRRDIDAWLPKVKRGGIIAGHDHCPDFPGVERAVQETFSRYEIWRGSRGPGFGDKRMIDTGLYYSVWSVRV